MPLQWVHGQITVVMRSRFWGAPTWAAASMGPRSDNRGYGHETMQHEGEVRASMGPRSDNRGYGPVQSRQFARQDPLQWVHGQITVVMSPGTTENPDPVMLQWVHGQITVVMGEGRCGADEPHGASMGPRSDNRGYAQAGGVVTVHPRFNGSTVR